MGAKSYLRYRRNFERVEVQRKADINMLCSFTNSNKPHNLKQSMISHGDQMYIIESNNGKSGLAKLDIEEEEEDSVKMA